MNPESEQWSERADEPGKLNVLGVFLTVDGEATGFHMGTWTVFVRLTGCRVGCRWCDTKYSWSIKQGELVTPPELSSLVMEMMQGATKISITGGEPLEQDSVALRTFVADMINRGFNVSMETSGTECMYDFSDWLSKNANRARMSFVVDYKLPSAHALKPFMWPNYSNMDDWDVIKFVVGDSNDFEEMVKVARHMRFLSHTTWKRGWMPRLVASPVVTDTPGSESKMTPFLLAESLKNHDDPICRQIGMNIQGHKYIWDDNARDEEEGVKWEDVLADVRQSSTNNESDLTAVQRGGLHHS